MVTDRCRSRVDAASSRVVFEKKYDRGSGRPRRGRIGRIAVFRRGKCEQQPAAVPRKVAGAAQPTTPLTHEEERLACLHLCKPAGTDVSPTHHVEGDLLSNTRGPFLIQTRIQTSHNKQCSQLSPSIKQASLPNVCFSAQKSH